MQKFCSISMITMIQSVFNPSFISEPNKVDLAPYDDEIQRLLSPLLDDDDDEALGLATAGTNAAAAAAAACP